MINKMDTSISMFENSLKNQLEANYEKKIERSCGRPLANAFYRRQKLNLEKICSRNTHQRKKIAIFRFLLTKNYSY